MMDSGHRQNDFLRELLHLQQDGKDAISNPKGWTDPPLLDIDDKVGQFVHDLGDSMLRGSEGNRTARWHFFVGSPGNGKSAAMGKLCRHLRDRGCQVRDEKNIDIDELGSKDIPYALNVYENGNNYSTAQIIQDASVARNLYFSDVDPAKDLCETMKSAWEKGISLVVCTNRGILDKAVGDNYSINGIKSQEWFRIISQIVNDKDFDGPWPFESKNDSVFEEAEITYLSLDDHSLLNRENVFERLVKKAVKDQHWQPCNSCASREMCPFKANRDWLANDYARDKVIRLLKRAEVLSGQVIVFREALAIISLVLAGCPKDYDDHVHPCEWVRQAIEKNDVFSLANRRIYMSLLASYSPLGLESVEALKKDQVKKIHLLCDVLDEDNSKKESRDAMECIIESRLPSTDVGATRILGASGIMAKLDSCRDALPEDFYDRWDPDDLEAVSSGQNPLFFTRIEQTCVDVWRDLEHCLERTSKHDVSDAHWALRRWSSNFLLHFGSLFKGRSAWSKELDDFSELLNLVGIPDDDQTITQKIKIEELDGAIGDLLLGNVLGKQDNNMTIQLSKTVNLSGEWVSKRLKPKTVSSKASGSVYLEVEFEGGERSAFAADMYLWLTRIAGGNLDERCFPFELLSGITDARVRAASRGKYAFADKDVELLIDTGNGKIIKLKRIAGAVGVIHV